MESVKKREPLFWINPRMRMECDHFFAVWEQIEYRLLAEQSVSIMRFVHKSGIIEIVIEKDFAGAYFLYTDNVDFRNMRLQCWLRHTLRDIIIERAKIILPQRLHYWEKQKNLYTKSIKVKNSERGYWDNAVVRLNI